MSDGQLGTMSSLLMELVSAGQPPWSVAIPMWIVLAVVLFGRSVPIRTVAMLLAAATASRMAVAAADPASSVLFMTGAAAVAAGLGGALSSLAPRLGLMLTGGLAMGSWGLSLGGDPIMAMVAGALLTPWMVEPARAVWVPVLVASFAPWWMGSVLAWPWSVVVCMVAMATALVQWGLQGGTEPHDAVPAPEDAE